MQCEICGHPLPIQSGPGRPRTVHAGACAAERNRRTAVDWRTARRADAKTARLLLHPPLRPTLPQPVPLPDELTALCAFIVAETLLAA
jgi:hypothetical protein